MSYYLFTSAFMNFLLLYATNAHHFEHIATKHRKATICVVGVIFVVIAPIAVVVIWVKTWFENRRAVKGEPDA